MESWISVNKISGTGNGTVSITLEPNESSEDRTGTVNVDTSTLNKILSITQKSLSMTVNVINITSDGDVYFNGERKDGNYLFNYFTSGALAADAATGFICNLFIEGEVLAVTQAYYEEQVELSTASQNSSNLNVVYTVIIRSNGEIIISQ